MEGGESTTGGTNGGKGVAVNSLRLGRRDVSDLDQHRDQAQDVIRYKCVISLGLVTFVEEETYRGGG